MGICFFFYSLQCSAGIKTQSTVDNVPSLFSRLHRQSSVEDLIKLAKQFDKNMQQDKETSEQLNTFNNNVNERLKPSKTKLAEMSFHSSVKDPKCPSSADQVEAELHALFDSSTQKVSGPLSQGSTASASSQEIKHKPVTSAGAEARQSELKSAQESSSAAEKGSCGFSANKCDEFDDDWENDDLLNDSFVLAMTANPAQIQEANLNVTFQSNTKTNAAHLKTTGDTNCANQPSNVNSKPSCSALQELCPKPKTTNRSTFKLESNPHFQPTAAAKEVSKSSLTVIQPKSQMSDQKSLTTKTLTAPPPDKIANDQRGACASAGSVKDISDSLWVDGDDDDALFYQVCDIVERTSYSQPQHESTNVCQKKTDIAGDRQQKTTAPLPIYRTWSMDAGASANRRSPCAFVRSNSLPGTNCETVNDQGWNIPMKGASSKSGMSQSLPGSRVSLGTFNQRRDSSGTFQVADMKAHTVTARPHHTGFKRNVSDSAATHSKGELIPTLIFTPVQTVIKYLNNVITKDRMLFRNKAKQMFD